jgi:hypothetical protein
MNTALSLKLSDIAADANWSLKIKMQKNPFIGIRECGND